MKTIVDLLRAQPAFISAKAPTAQEVTQAEKALGVTFAADYRDYVAALGVALCIGGIVLTASRTGMVAMVFLTAWGVLDRRLPRTLRVTLVAAPLLDLAGELYGVLVVEDIMGILMLVLLPTIALGNSIDGGELLISTLKLISFLVLKHANFSLENMFQEATSIHEKGEAIMGPGTMVKDPIDALSLGLALMFGTAGLPHILMRFFTVPDAKEARKSVFVATGLIGYFYILTFVIGFGAIIYVTQDNPHFFQTMVKEGKTVVEMIGGTNMAAIHLSEA